MITGTLENVEDQPWERNVAKKLLVCEDERESNMSRAASSCLVIYDGNQMVLQELCSDAPIAATEAVSSQWSVRWAGVSRSCQ